MTKNMGVNRRSRWAAEMGGLDDATEENMCEI